MTDNDLTPPRDETYELTPVRNPQAIDGEAHEAAAEALAEFDGLLVELVGYAEKVEGLVRSAMMTEAVTLPDNLQHPDGTPDSYAGATYELAATAKANQAVGMASSLITQAAAELAKPIAESRRAF